MDDLEHEEIQALLSTPAEAVAGQVHRRTFLKGALAVGAGTALVPAWADHMAAAATPIGAHDGVLVVLQLGGGNDGLGLVSPTAAHRDSGRYRTARGNLAVTGALGLADGLGLHPRLPRLKARWDAGQVAVVQGVGQTTSDLSHFTSTAAWMAGTKGTSRTTGWLGRWLDGVPESAEGLRAVQIGASVPLHLRGQRSVVTAMGVDPDLFGSDRSEPWMAPVYDGVTRFGAGTTGRGRLSDLIADTGASSIALAQRLAPVYPATKPPGDLVPELTLAARLVNANLGVRVISCSHGSYDLHDGMGYSYGVLMDELDAGIEAFFTTLAPAFRDRVALMTFSEFGRTVRVNGSGGTDHGTASPQLVIGANVRGGLHGTQPRLDDLDGRGDLKVQVDLRSYYASIVDGWLAGGSSTVLGGTYPDLGLFRRSPGGPSTPPPPVDLTWRPFPDPSTLVRQQYLDFLGRPADQAGVTYWVGKLTGGSSIAWVLDAFLSSQEFGAVVAPAARLALAGLGDPYRYADLMGWAARLRVREPLATVAADVAAEPDFASRYGGLADRAFVDRLHLDATGRAAASGWAADRAARLGARTASRGDVLAEVVELPAAIAHLRVRVEVTMTYAGLLRRAPDPSGYAFWVDKGESGASIQRLIAMFYASAEYRGRFA